MRERAPSSRAASADPSRARRADPSAAAAVLRLQRGAGNAAVTAGLGIQRQGLGFGPPIVYSPVVRDLIKAQGDRPPDLMKTDPMNPGSGLPSNELRQARLDHLRKHGPQPRAGAAPWYQEGDPRWRAMRAAYPEGGLAGRLIDHYANGGGKEFTLSKADVLEAAPSINLNQTFARGNVSKWVTNHIGLHREIEALRKAGGGSKHVAFQGTGSAATHGTLGSFTLLYDGDLRVAPPGGQLDEGGATWHFKGTAIVYDVYNFDARSDRHPAGEIMTGVGRHGMTGDPFPIVSDPVEVEQADIMLHAYLGGRSADGSHGKPSLVHPYLKHVLPDPMAGSGSSSW